MKNVFYSVFIFITLTTCSDNSTDTNLEIETDVYKILINQSELDVKEISPVNGFERQFEVYITQPLDHNNPDGIKFEQRIFVSHTDINSPVIFMPSGYSSSPAKVCELSETLNANQVYVAQRFMVGAEPEPKIWEFLNGRQIAEDFHRVVEVFRNIYKGSWISYGASKNGQSALIHKRFYPEDVNATITIGSSLAMDEEDFRFEQFLSSVGNEFDRIRIKNFQIAALRKREGIANLLENYLRQSEYSFSQLSVNEILEYEILEFPFAFWQTSDGNTSDIPDSNASSQELFNFIRGFGYLDYYSDQLLDFSKPVYYQAYTELGWYRLIDDHLKDLITSLLHPSYKNLGPKNVTITYNPEFMTDMVSWLQISGNNIIYIYGENDPWTACAIESVGLTNSLKIIQPNANHNIKINELIEHDLVITTLTKWIN